MSIRGYAHCVNLRDVWSRTLNVKWNASSPSWGAKRPPRPRSGSGPVISATSCAAGGMCPMRCCESLGCDASSCGSHGDEMETYGWMVAAVVAAGYVLAVWLPDFRADIRGIRARRARHAVAGVVAGPAPAGPPALLRAGVDVAVATEDDQADYGHTTALARKGTEGVRR